MNTISAQAADKIGAQRKQLNNRYERKFKRGSLIFIEGEMSSEMFIIRSGKIRILKQEGDNTVELAQLGAGSVLGELSLLDHQPRGATAQVIEDVTATVIDEELLQSTLQKIPSWLSNIILVVVKRLRDTVKRTADDIVRQSVAGSIRIMLLLCESCGQKHEEGISLPISMLKDAIYATIGLGNSETENVFLHLILKELLVIRKNSLGEELVIVRNPEIANLYMSWLRAKQRGTTLAGDGLGAPALQLVQTLLEAGEKNGKVIQQKLIRLTVQQVEIELARAGKERHVDRDALDELLGAKVIAREQSQTATAHGAHAIEGLVFNKTTLEKIRQLSIWLPIFREDVVY